MAESQRFEKIQSSKLITDALWGLEKIFSDAYATDSSHSSTKLSLILSGKN